MNTNMIRVPVGSLSDVEGTIGRVLRGLDMGFLPSGLEGDASHRPMRGGSRDNDRNYFQHDTGVGQIVDVTKYFTGGSRPLLFKRSHLIMVVADAAETDVTVASDWDYNSDAAPTSWTVIVAGQVIDVGSTPTNAALVTFDADLGVDLDIRVPAGVTVRNVLDIEGTTPAIHIIGVGEYQTL